MRLENFPLAENGFPSPHPILPTFHSHILWEWTKGVENAFDWILLSLTQFSRECPFSENRQVWLPRFLSTYDKHPKYRGHAFTGMKRPVSILLCDIPGRVRCHWKRLSLSVEPFAKLFLNGVYVWKLLAMACIKVGCLCEVEAQLLGQSLPDHLKLLIVRLSNRWHPLPSPQPKWHHQRILRPSWSAIGSQLKKWRPLLFR